jgi:phospholipid/cholesterol/gamma-HCH transport system permease protein
VEVDRALAARPAAARLSLDADGLAAWDSRLVSFILAVARLCEQRRVEVDASGLPDGAERLMRLATALPEKQGARRTAERTPLLARLGSAWLGLGKALREAISFLGEVSVGMARLVTGRARLRAADLWDLMEDCGAKAAGIVCLTSLLTGMSIAFVGAIQLAQFGAEIFVADLVALSAVREMAPSMTAFVMAGRTGAAFAARIGTMQVNEEVDALKTLGIPPVDFLVTPRILALVLMMPLLYFYACLLAILGGAIVVLGTLNVSAFAYYHQTIGALDLVDFAIGVVKAVVFGALIGFFGCYCGIRCGRSAAAVGEAATAAVVQSIVAIIVANMIFAVLTNILGV